MKRNVLTMLAVFCLSAAANAVSHQGDPDQFWKRTELPETKLSLQIFGETTDPEVEKIEDGGPAAKKSTRYTFAGESRSFSATILVFEGEEKFKTTGLMVHFMLSGMIKSYKEDDSVKTEVRRRATGKFGEFSASQARLEHILNTEAVVEEILMIGSGNQTFVIVTVYDSREPEAKKESEKVMDSIYFAGSPLTDVKELKIDTE